MSKKRFAIFVSGNGTNMENIVKAVARRKIRNAEVAFVFSDNPEAYALTRARRLKVASVVFSPKDFSAKETYEQELLRVCKNEKVDFIVLAGYMRLVGKTLLTAYRNKILNIHPALLPSFPGVHGIKDAHDYGVKITGVTVHLVDTGIDTGPIIFQEAVTIRSHERVGHLEKRIHAIEYKLYPQAIQCMANGKIKINGRKVIV